MQFMPICQSCPYKAKNLFQMNRTLDWQNITKHVILLRSSAYNWLVQTGNVWQPNIAHQTQEQKKCFKLFDQMFDGLQIF